MSAVLSNKFIANKTVPTPGDLYAKGYAVYKVTMYNETQQTVLFATTNDEIITPGKIHKNDIRNNGFFLCPLALRPAATQVFELDEILTSQSLEGLFDFRKRMKRTYSRLKITNLLSFVENSSTREYKVPEQQGLEFPVMKDKTFQILMPFYALSKEKYKELAAESSVYIPKAIYDDVVSYTQWPVWFVPSRFE